MVDKAKAVAQLYTLMPDAFTAARNGLAAETSKSDKEQGRVIRSLPKPSAGAWLVNMLALHRPELIAEVLELGAVLREAQNDMDQQQLRRLSGERQRLLRSAARDARSLAENLGRPVSAAVGAEVEQTLWAAMTDPDAAAAAASGQLVRTLEAIGWDPVDMDGSVADPASVPPLSATGAQRRSTDGPSAGNAQRGSASLSSSDQPSKDRAAIARALRAAQATLADAQRASEQAEQALRAAQDEVDAVADRRDELTDEIDELRSRIHDLEREVVAVDRRSGSLERARDTARRTARAARRATEKAQAKLEAGQQAQIDPTNSS